ncbi:MAG TPA: hypothetical protein VKE50_05125, partial [Thermoanaerobaculia bacterium]|nr:hypothetical protein [Thermoanaerobaculia bacterium]
MSLLLPTGPPVAHRLLAVMTEEMMSLKRFPAILFVLCAALAFACRVNQSLEGQAKDAKIATQIKSR